MAKKCTKTVQNDENLTLSGLWVIGTPEIVHKLFTKLRPVFSSFFTFSYTFGPFLTSFELQTLNFLKNMAEKQLLDQVSTLEIT